uniref:Uncharacterized protein n=1 Tax=Meloidogyne enterolobii TaxID=390850 RepID=A0A6V7XZW1_MELEN|nr:unnamed protein product [Meloidogyne enterolobii]
MQKLVLRRKSKLHVLKLQIQQLNRLLFGLAQNLLMLFVKRLQSFVQHSISMMSN